MHKHKQETTYTVEVALIVARQNDCSDGNEMKRYKRLFSSFLICSNRIIQTKSKIAMIKDL